MAKTSYFVVDPNGATHTRNSARVYTHAVVYQRSKANAIDWAMSSQQRAQDMKNAQYYLDCIAVGYHENLMGFDHYRNDKKRQAQDVAEAVEKLAGAKSAGQYADALRADALARIEATDYSLWFVAGWCGRFDLAQRLASQHTGAMILPASSR